MMDGMWTLWWAWASAAVVLAILEVFAPGFVLLGFAIGAGVVALLLGVGGPLSAALTGSLPVLLLLFAVFSLVAWLVLRRVTGVRAGQVKIWDRDINEE